MPLDGLERKLCREAVRYAVQKAIFCPDCDEILDMDNAVLITGSKRAGVACGPCWDKTIARMKPVDHATFMALIADKTISVDDGRELKKED